MDLPLTNVLLYFGITLQVYNIANYYYFLHKTGKDALTRGDPGNKHLSYAALDLLLFFLAGYVFVAVRGSATLMIGCIFFFGALFCSLMIRITIRLTSTIKKRSADITKAMVKVIEERDPNLNGHSVYVRNLCMAIWRHLPDGLQSKINPVDLEYASLLHDIGKLGIAESILNKPGKLTDNEWQAMREHPQKGVEILEQLRFFSEILPWIHYHHERIDGKGYYGIAGKDIPLGARIIAVADTYSVITMKRSYKAARSYEEAILIIKSVSGTQLDEDLVRIFCGIPKAEILECVPDTIKAGNISS